MDWNTPKRFDELPVFRVTVINATDDGANSRLSGVFDGLKGVKEGPCYLLQSSPESLDSIQGSITDLSSQSRRAIFVADADVSDWAPTPLLLRYLSDIWEPVHVWMISVPTWQFERRVFQAGDAFAAKRSPSAAPPPPTGEEVRFWLELTSASSPNKKRYFPNRELPEGLVSGAWDHEHCQLCRGHVDSGQAGYIDNGGRWLCVTCYRRYIRPC